jgi:hypothetical protein
VCARDAIIRSIARVLTGRHTAASRLNTTRDALLFPSSVIARRHFDRAARRDDPGQRAAAKLAAGDAWSPASGGRSGERGFALAREGGSGEPGRPERCISMAENVVT